MNKERVLFETIQDFFMCVVITITVSLLNKTSIISVQFIWDLLLAYAINLCVGFLLPEMQIAKMFTKGISDNRVIKYSVLIPGIIAIINVSIILSGVLLVKLGFSMFYFRVWISLYPTLIIVGIVAACILFKATNKLVELILSK